MSNITKKYRICAAVLLIISILFNVAPLAAYTITGLVEADLVIEKVTLTSTIFVVAIMSIVPRLSTTRSRVWIIMLGLYFCLDAFVTPLLIIAITQMLDEIIISPLHKYYRNKYRINKEIDHRGVA